MKKKLKLLKKHFLFFFKHGVAERCKEKKLLPPIKRCESTSVAGVEAFYVFFWKGLVYRKGKKRKGLYKTGQK